MQQAKKPACFRQEPAGALVPHFIHLGPRELFPCLMQSCALLHFPAPGNIITFNGEEPITWLSFSTVLNAWIAVLQFYTFIVQQNTRHIIPDNHFSLMHYYYALLVSKNSKDQREEGMGGLTHVLHAHGGLTTHTCPPTWSIESLQYPVYLLPYLFQSTIQQARSNSSTTFKPFPGSCCQVIPLLLLTNISA